MSERAETILGAIFAVNMAALALYGLLKRDPMYLVVGGLGLSWYVGRQVSQRYPGQ